MMMMITTASSFPVVLLLLGIACSFVVSVTGTYQFNTRVGYNDMEFSVTGGSAQLYPNFLEFNPSSIGDAILINVPNLHKGRYTVEIKSRSTSVSGAAAVHVNNVDTGIVADFAEAAQNGKALGKFKLGFQRATSDGTQVIKLVCTDTVGPMRLVDIYFGHRPNVMIIHSDDQTRSDVASYGGNVLTPNIDKIGERGVLFRKAYVSSPVCTPSRYNMFSGKYATRNVHLQRVHPTDDEARVAWDTFLRDYDEVLEFDLVQQKLAQAGYRTGIVGKWHLGGRQITLNETERALKPGNPGWEEVEDKMAEFRENVKDYAQECGFLFTPYIIYSNLEDKTRPKFCEEHFQEVISFHTNEFLKKQVDTNDRPWFVDVSTTLVHSPNPKKTLQYGDIRIHPYGYYDEEEEMEFYEGTINVMPNRSTIFKKLKHGYRKSPGGFGTLYLDEGVGAIMNELERLDMVDDTVIFYISDHGFGNSKMHAYENGARVPFMVSYAGKFQQGAEQWDLVSNIDIAPTIYEILDLPMPDVIDGKSILPLLTGVGSYYRPHLYMEIGYSRAIITANRLKYIAVRFNNEIELDIEENGTNYTQTGFPAVPYDKPPFCYGACTAYPDYYKRDQLYDLKFDPTERQSRDGWPGYQVRLNEMKDILREYSATLPHPFGEFTETP